MGKRYWEIITKIGDRPVPEWMLIANTRDHQRKYGIPDQKWRGGE